jgi:hypothetical protein
VALSSRAAWVVKSNGGIDLVNAGDPPAMLITPIELLSLHHTPYYRVMGITSLVYVEDAQQAVCLITKHQGRDK